jgi:hypothetical protein
MRNRFAVETAVVFAVAIMITIPFNGIILPSLMTTTANEFY